MIIRTVIYILNLLNLFLFFRLLLGCEFRKTRSSVVIGLLFTAGLWALYMPWMNAYIMEMPDVSGILYALLPVIWLKGRWANLFLAGIAFFYATAPLDNLICGIMMVAKKGETYFAYFDYYVIVSQLLTSVIFAGLIYSTRNYRKTINEVASGIKLLMLLAFLIFLYGIRSKWGYIGDIDIDTAMWYQGINHIKDAIISLVSTILFITLTFVFYQRRCLRREIRLKERCIEEQAEQYAFMGRANQEWRKFRHDFKKHMDVLIDLYDHEQMDELGAYIHQLSDIKERTYYINTGNMICDAIVNRYYVKCRDAGISLKCSGSFPDDLSVEMTDLCILMSNAIDNAYEATVQCEGNREIQCKIGNRKGLTFITLINPVSIPPVIEDRFIKTSKDDAQNHGFGTKNMQEAAMRNGGSVRWRYDAKNGIVETKICLKAKKM